MTSIIKSNKPYSFSILINTIIILAILSSIKLTDTNINNINNTTNTNTNLGSIISNINKPNKIHILLQIFDKITNTIHQEQVNTNLNIKNTIEYCNSRNTNLMNLIKSRKKDEDNFESTQKRVLNDLNNKDNEVKRLKNKRVKNDSIMKSIQTHRCDVNILFIENLKKYKDSLASIKQLNTEVNIMFRNGLNSGSSSSNINKLLRMIEALNSVNSITVVNNNTSSNNNSPKEAQLIMAELKEEQDKIDKINHEKKTNIHYKETEFLKQENNNEENQTSTNISNTINTPNTTNNTNIHIRIIAWLNSLSSNIQQSKSILEEIEIKSANDYSDFKSSILEENNRMQSSLFKSRDILTTLNNSKDILSLQVNRRNQMTEFARKEYKLFYTQCEDTQVYNNILLEMQMNQRGLVNQIKQILNNKVKLMNDILKGKDILLNGEKDLSAMYKREIDSLFSESMDEDIKKSMIGNNVIKKGSVSNITSNIIVNSSMSNTSDYLDKIENELKEQSNNRKAVV